MAEAFLAPIVKGTLSKVISVATEQLNSVVGYSEELRRFCVALKMAKGLLQHAEEKKATEDPGVDVWLKELRRIADEADVVVDEIGYENLKRKATQKLLGKQVTSFFTTSNPVAVRLRMASKINALIVSLDEVNTRANGFGLQSIIANKKDPEHNGLLPRTDACLGDPSRVVGREGDAREIVKLLIESNVDQSPGVVSIVGIGGLGKTTLAKLICNDDLVKRHFSKIMWICVSESFNVFNILGEMLQSLTRSGSGDMTNQNSVVEKIKAELKEKNFLLVLDDVWNEDERECENLRNCLMAIARNVRSSRVLVTTRLPKVASMMRSLDGRIEQLSDDDCWSIIKERTFGNSSAVPSELEEIGRKIAIKCKGVPLVAIVVGGTLRDDRNEDHWLSFEKDFDACGALIDNDAVRRVLKLSFDRLPRSALKQCFSYCSVFPKDYIMEMEMLIQLWMAQGFLQPPQGIHMEMEEIGEKYFMELVSYSFFQDVKRDSYGRIISCKVHDLMHDLAKSISNSETLVLEGSAICDMPDIRHMNLITGRSMHPTKMVKVFQELHSLFLNVDVSSDTLIQSKRLLVLDFSGAYIRRLPSFLGKLKRLRYLDISYCRLKKFPKFISKLYHLQTLRFIECLYIQTPLEGIEYLNNLKHICFTEDRLMPARIGDATCLQTLPMFVVYRQKGRGIEELERLSQLKGDLRISNLNLVRGKVEAVKAKLCEKTAITELELRFDSGQEEYEGHHEDVLEGLKPHSNLKGLILRQYDGKHFPSWMLESSSSNLGGSIYIRNLSRLEFISCGHLKSIPSLSLNTVSVMRIDGCREMESIGPLSLSSAGELSIKKCPILKDVAVSSLRSLKIKSCGELVSIQFGSLAIASLKEINIKRCERLENLPVIGGFPVLQKLCLRSCQNLRCIGDSSASFASSECLVELAFIDCPSLVTLPRLVSLLSLGKVYIRDCQQIESVDWGSLSHYACLTELKIDNCDWLVHFPTLQGVSCLQTFEIKNCQQLTSIEGQSFSLCLKQFFVENCPALTSIYLDELPLCLEALRVRNCPALKSVQNLSGLSSLQSLSLGGFSEELEEFPDLSSVQHLSSSLKELTLLGWEKLQHLPDQIQYLTGLMYLKIEKFNGLQSLPDWLGNLSSLQLLSISKCSSLTQFPSMEAMHRLSNLDELSVKNCPELKERCARETGSEWGKISHIRIIYTDTGYYRNENDSRQGYNFLRSTFCWRGYTSDDEDMYPKYLGWLYEPSAEFIRGSSSSSNGSDRYRTFG